jgi:tRNA threonylcarbamoyl adenosine modification protein YeaZ
MYLSIDTSGQSSSVAIIANDYAAIARVVAERQESSQSHSSSLDAIIRATLTESGLHPKDLEGIVIGSGPGSFTGLRIGFAFAKGLASSLSIGLAKVSSLRAAAFAVKSKAKAILAIDKASKEEFYVASFVSENHLTVYEEETIVRREWINNWLGSNPKGLVVSANNSEISGVEKVELLASSIGLSLFEEAKPEFSLNSLKLADFSPTYLRKVAALSIAERRAKGMI